MKPIHKSVYGAAALCLSFAALVFVTTPLTDHFNGFDSDGLIYAAVGGSNQAPEELAGRAPWCYRILTPYLAAALPLEILAGFRLIAFMAVTVSLLLMFLILREIGNSNASSLFGVLLYAGVFWTVKFSFFAPAYIDHVTQMFLLLIVFLTITQRYLLLVPVFLLAALQKESLVVYSLFSVWHLMRSSQTRSAWSSRTMAGALLVLPPAVLLAVRLLIDAPESTGPSMFFVHLREMAHPSFWPVFLQSVFSGLGLIPVVLLLRPQAWLRFLQNHSEWVLYLLLSVGLLFGGVDKARLFLYGLPAWVILATQVFEAPAQRLPRRRLLVWAGALLVTHGYVGGYLTGTGTFENYLAEWVPVHSEGRYVPYLIRNLLLAVAMMLMSVRLVGRQPADPVS